MSEELNQKKEALRLLWSFNQYFTSANGVDVPDRISVKRDEWRLLCDALCAAPSQPNQPASGAVVDRSEAVNLAYNTLHAHKYKSVTPMGVRTLCEAVLRMDAVLLSATPPAPTALNGGKP